MLTIVSKYAKLSIDYSPTSPNIWASYNYFLHFHKTKQKTVGEGLA